MDEEDPDLITSERNCTNNAHTSGLSSGQKNELMVFMKDFVDSYKSGKLDNLPSST